MQLSARVKKLGIALTGSALLGLMTFLFTDRLWPLPELDQSNHATTVVARDGTPLRVFADKKGVWRFQTRLDEVSPLYIEALLGYEDQYFYWHPGINPIAVMRALAQNIRHNDIISGASTLTMQVARLIDPHQRSLGGKLKQIFRTLQLEWHLSKTQILELYLALSPFGGNLQGVEAASRAYFGKAPTELSHAEAALLAVLPQAPSRYRPDRHPARASQARDKLVQRLIKHDIWPEKMLDEVRMEPVYANTPAMPILAPILSRRLKNTFPANSRIETSIDYGLQTAVETRLRDYVSFLPPGTTASAVIVENENWLARAYVGSALFADQKTRGYVDMVTARRSPGSTLKPFIYGLAMDQSLIHSQSLLVDAPRWQSSYQPENFSSQYSGAVSTTSALQKSLNIPAVQVLEALGPAYFNNRLLNTGVQPVIPAGRPNLSMALGGFGITMQELLNLYGALGRGGQVAQLRFSAQEPLNERPFLSAQAAWIVHSMLASQPRPGESSIRKNSTLGFKTGTSYGFRDAWAFGVSGKYTLGIWVGRPDGTPSPGQFGAATALPLLFQLSDWLADTSQPIKPTRISEQDICWPSGLRKSDISANQCLATKTALGIDGQFPATLPATTDTPWQGTILNLKIATDSGLRSTPECGIAAQTKQLTIWPVATEPWLNKKWRRNSLIPKTDPRCRHQAIVLNNTFSISSIRAGAHIRNIKPDMPFHLPLSTLGGAGRNHWYLDGKKLRTNVTSSSADISLTSGKHTLLAINESGASDMVQFSVEQW